MGSGPILSTTKYCPFWVHPSNVPFWAQCTILVLGRRGLGPDSSRAQCTHEYSRLGPEKRKYYPFGKAKSEKVVFAIHNDHYELCCWCSEIIGYPRIDWCACFKVVFSSSVQITTSAFSLWQNDFMHVQHRSQQATARGWEGEKFWQAIDP